MKRGDKEKAIEHYTKSVALNPGNQGALDRLKLGVSTTDVTKEIVVDTTTLESYVGQYQLAPRLFLPFPEMAIN